MPHTSILYWSQEQADSLTWSCFVFSLLSVAGCLFIFVTFAAFPSRRKKIVQRLVFNLSITHFFFSLTWILPGPRLQLWVNVCPWLTPIRYYSLIASCLWSCAIASEMLAKWLRARRNQFEILYHVIAWSVPIIFLLPPTVSQSRDPVFHMCWYDIDYILYVIYIFLFVCMMYCIVVYSIALYKLREVNSYDPHSYGKLQNQKMNELKWQVAGYMLSSLITWVPFGVLQTMNAYADDKVPSVQTYVFALLCAMSQTSGGFISTIIYGWDRKLWETVISQVLCRRRPYSRRNSGHQLVSSRDASDPMRPPWDSPECSLVLDEDSD